MGIADAITISFVSYLAGFLAYLLLTILLLTSWRGQQKGRWLIVAAGVMTIWAGGIALQELYGIFSAQLVWTLEVLHVYAWLFFFGKLLSRGEHQDAVNQPDLIRWGVQVVALAQIAYIWLSPFLERSYPEIFRPSYQLSGHVVLAVFGLVIVEQYFRNARTDQRWRIKFLCLSLGSLFAYDFYLYSEALLFQHIPEDLWAARGAVAALLTPFIAVSAARNPDWSVDIFVSRQAIFHSAALLGTGAYLLLMATAGYYIRVFGGEWGPIAQIVFLVGALLVLVMVLFSGQIRARIRVFLSRNFFNYAYDYRQEWLRLIATLSESGTGLSLEERVIVALGQVVESPSGILWAREATGRFVWRASYGDPDIDIPVIEGDDPAVQYLQREESTINLKEMLARPEMYEGLSRPFWVERHDNAWLLVPLCHRGGSMDGIVLLSSPRTPIVWNWEVVDMLRTTSRLAASYLALEDAGRQLAEARQFDGFNRLSAFVIHDLKNLIAQLSLVVRNAEKHQNNPQFMADAIRTVDHSVSKMNTLMSQLRNASPAAAASDFDLGQLVREVVEVRKKQPPPPECKMIGESLIVWANRDRLGSALEHVIHNGQDAAGKQGRVVVRLRAGGNHVAWVEVEDNGGGMDDEFIRNRLFKPFETTKGLTGMGIGAYESREYVRSLGGELSVESAPGRGSLFRFSIPLAQAGAVPSIGQPGVIAFE